MQVDRSDVGLGRVVEGCGDEVLECERSHRSGFSVPARYVQYLADGIISLGQTRTNSDSFVTVACAVHGECLRRCIRRPGRGRVQGVVHGGFTQRANEEEGNRC